MSILNALTIDVEDYYHVSAFESGIRRDEWGSFQTRVEDNTIRLLDILDRQGVKATFFVLGWVARQFPQLVRRIADGGHEIGSHSYWHRLIYQLTPDEFRADLRDSRDVLEDITGQRVTTFRAPSFSVTKKSLWALDILAEEGFESDSSIFPIRHDRYGIPGAKAFLHQLETKSGHLWELPPSVLTVRSKSIPVSGGGYFRLYPFPFTSWCLSQINDKLARPFMFYIHPWEIDPQQPRVQTASRVSKFRHYVNLASTESKLERLLTRFRFGRMCDVINQCAHMPLLDEDAPFAVAAPSEFHSRRAERPASISEL